MPPLAPPPGPATPTSLLLVLRGPVGAAASAFGRCLPRVSQRCHRLYVHLLSESDDAPLPAAASKTLRGIYVQGARVPHLDIRVLLRGLKRSSDKFSDKLECFSDKFSDKWPKVRLDKVVFGGRVAGLSDEFVRSYSDKYGVTAAERHELLEGEEDSDKYGSDNTNSDNTNSDNFPHPVSHAVLGGTFDRLHSGHKILLSESQLLANSSLTVGVTEQCMLVKKTLPELILPGERRRSDLFEFLSQTDPTLEYKVVPITDPFGPSIVDPELQLIVGSEETRRGCEKVNELREKAGLDKLKIHLIAMEEDPVRQSSAEEAKISSSSQRIRMLGTLLKEPIKKWDKTQGPYVIGLTGNSASGKSSLAKKVAQIALAAGHKVGVVDCDQLGHRAYEPGTDCFNKVVEAFGRDIVDDASGKIDRARLGAKVFGAAENKSRLESLVWPEILKMADVETAILHKNGHAVVILDAAVLLSAGWHRTRCHQVWSCVVGDEEEAVRRIMERDGKTREQALARLAGQAGADGSVRESNVVFCTRWEPDVTREQAERAWRGLQELMGL